MWEIRERGLRLDMETREEPPRAEATSEPPKIVELCSWDERVRACDANGLVLRSADLPKDPKTGFVRLFYEDLPLELNPRKRPEEERLLPVPPMMLQERIIGNANKFDAMLMFWPLIDLPVYVPKFVQLLVGEFLRPVESCFSLLRLYHALGSMWDQTDFVHSRTRDCFDWVTSRLREGQLTGDDLLTFGRACVWIDAKIRPLEPGADDLIAMHEAGTLAKEHVDLAKGRVKCARACGGAWEREVAYCEDLLVDANQERRGLDDSICDKFEEMRGLPAEQKYASMREALRLYTWLFLRTYEKCLLRLLDAGTPLSLVPQQFHGDLASGATPPPPEHVCEEAERTVLANRKMFGDLRDKHLRKVAVERSDGEEDATASDPTRGELFAFDAFLAYDPETEEELRRDLAAAEEDIERQNRETADRIEKKIATARKEKDDAMSGERRGVD